MDVKKKKRPNIMLQLHGMRSISCVSYWMVFPSFQAIISQILGEGAT